MISNSVLDSLKKFVPTENIYRNELMAAHTTFRVGGPADCLVEITDGVQLQKVKHYLDQVGIPYMILGNGSNVLFSDEGYRGIVLSTNNRMNQVHVEGNTITAQAGAMLSMVAKLAYEHGLTGLEFASGIPGTIGGAVVMNAGAYDGEMSQVVATVTVLDRENNFAELDNETMEFGYRTSAIKNYPFVVTEVKIELALGDKEAIKAKMDDFANRRREKQPLEYPSAGSTFKRPEGHFAGKLIMDAGLRGFQIGGAKVSEKHCGFVVNAGGATASDVRNVMSEVQRHVKEEFQVDLEPEVILIGFKD